MSLTDQLNKARQAATQPKPSCTVGKLVHRSTPDDAQALTTALNADTDEWPNRAIADATGINIHTIRRHRRGECQCDKGRGNL